MTPETIAAIGAAIPPTLLALGGLIAAIKSKNAAQASLHVSEGNSEKADRILGLADGNLSRMRAELENANKIVALVQGDLTNANRRIEAMQDLVSQLVKAAAAPAPAPAPAAMLPVVLVNGAGFDPAETAAAETPAPPIEGKLKETPTG